MFHCSVIKDRFCIAVCLKQLFYYIMSFPACQELFSTFLKLFLFLSCSNFGSISCLPLSCQELFFLATLRFSPNGEGGIWTLAPLLTTSSLSRGAPSTTWVLLHMCLNLIFQYVIDWNGESGIRTHAPLRTNGFQDRLVMTTSISLHIMFFNIFVLFCLRHLIFHASFLLDCFCQN